MKITTYAKKIIDVDTDPERCRSICGFKPNDIIEKEGFKRFRILGVANGVNDKGIGAREGNAIVVWGHFEGDEKCEAGYFYNEYGADLKKMGFKFVKTFQEYIINGHL